MQIALGIDIGGTTTKLAAINCSGKVFGKRTFDTRLQRNEEDYFDSLFLSMTSLIKDLNDQQEVIGIGISAPSCFPREGTIKQAANLPFSERVEIVDILENRFQLPVVLIKDGNAAAVGEGLFGAAKGIGNYIVLTLGTGLGCGIVIDHKIVSGNSGLAGELGHTLVEAEGRECGCGRKGCFETYVSATGIKRTVFQLLATYSLNSILSNIPFNAMTSKMIFEAAEKGDQLAIRAFDYTGQILGRKLSELISLFEPETIILAGGLAGAGKFLFHPAILQMERNMLAYYHGRVKVLPSILKTNEAALLGLASLVCQNKTSNTP